MEKIKTLLRQYPSHMLGWERKEEIRLIEVHAKETIGLKKRSKVSNAISTSKMAVEARS